MKKRSCADPDLFKKCQHSLGIGSRSKGGEFFGLVAQPGEAGQQMQVTGGISSRNRQKKDKLHGPAALGTPNQRFRGATEGKLQFLDAAEAAVRKSDAARMGGAGHKLMVQGSVIERQQIGDTSFALQHLA